MIFFPFSSICDVSRTKRDCNMPHGKLQFVSCVVKYVVLSDCLEKWAVPKV